MSEYRPVLERAASNAPQPDLDLERVLRRRDRKRRNQRIAAGVVGIAVFVAAVGLVTTFGSTDRTQPGASGGAVTGPAETGPAETGPPPAPASAAPDVVRQGTCTNGARSRLELTKAPDQNWIQVRFEVYRGPGGHWWRITLRYYKGLADPHPQVAAITRRLANDSGEFAVQLPPGILGTQLELVGTTTHNGFLARAVDTATGQVCRADAEIW